MNEYILEDLKLQHTYISDGTGDLNGYWQWKEDDAYLAAGAIISDIEDMMKKDKSVLFFYRIFLHQREYRQLFLVLN